MRFSSLFGHVATTGFFLTPFSLVDALSFTSVSDPDLDLSSLGRVTFVGNFDTASLYSYTQQSSVNDYNDNNNNNLLTTPLPNGVITDFSVADSNILALCTLIDENDARNNVVFAGGNFTSLNGVESRGVALVDPNSRKVTPLPGIDGSVATVLCDPKINGVYVGGDFRRTNSNSSNAAIWSRNHGGGSGWVDLSFRGFNGPVSSIIKKNDSDIIFGGEFDGVVNSVSSHHRRPTDTQFVNIQNATVSSDSSSDLSGFNDPRNVICQSSGEDGPGKTWLLRDNSPGFWRAEMRFGFRPTKIRLYNTHFEGRGTKSFLLRALPSNGIMNLTYFDPDSRKVSFCDSVCSLPHDPREPYREFRLVNNIGMGGFQLEFSQWYGSGAGLNGIELFGDGKYMSMTKSITDVLTNQRNPHTFYQRF